MLKMVNAYTQELDDHGKAVREIHELLDIKNSLLKNSVALLFCHAKFIETGAAEAVYKSLPLDVLGCTSLYFGMTAETGAIIEGEFLLTVTILTSDDIQFSSGVSLPLNENNVEECVNDLYQRTASPFGEFPSLVFAFMPTMTSVPADSMAAFLNRVCGGAPVFGSVALDMNTRIQNPRTIYKSSAVSGAFSDRMAFLFFKGQVKPRFFHSFFPEKSILPWDAVITKASGNRIISINNKPALSFIKEQGFFQNNIDESIMVYPLVIEYPNHNVNVVVLHDISPEGQLICSRNVQAGGILNIGVITADSVLEGAKVIAQNLKNVNKKEFIIFSCFLRNVVLGGSSQAEFDLFRQELSDYTVPWLFINSGGELCPGYAENGETVNQFHQYALIACQF